MCLGEGEVAIVRKAQALKREGIRDNLMPWRETHFSGKLRWWQDSFAGHRSLYVVQATCLQHLELRHAMTEC
jgi:hypothetical protein